MVASKRQKALGAHFDELSFLLLLGVHTSVGTFFIVIIIPSTSPFLPATRASCYFTFFF